MGTVAIPALTGMAVDAIQRSDGSELRTLGLAIAGAGIAALGPHRRPAARRGARLARRRAATAPDAVRPPAVARARVLRPPADRSAHVARDRRPAVRAVLPRLRPRLDPAVGADDRPSRRSRCSSSTRCSRSISLVPVPFVVWVAARYGRRSRPALQEVQQRIAELTAEAEEDDRRRARRQGLRARGPPARALRAPATAACSTSDGLDAASQRVLQPAHRLPAPDRARRVLLIVGGRQVIDGAHDARRVHRLLHVPARCCWRPMRSLGMALGLAQRATASGARLFEILDREPRVVAPADAPPLPAGAGDVELRDVSLRYEGATARRRCTTSRSTSTAGTTRRARRRDRLGQDDARRSSSPRLYDVDGGRGAASTAPTSATSTRARCAREIAVVDDDPFLFSRERRATTSPTRAPDATDEEVERGRAARAGARLHRAAARRLRHARRRARPDAQRRPAPADRDRPRAARRPADPRPRRRDVVASTRRPSSRSRRRCARSWPGARRSSSPTACRRSRWPTRSSCSRTASSSPRAPTTSCSSDSELYREIVEKGLPDQVFLTRKPPSPRWRGCERARGQATSPPRASCAAAARSGRPRAQGARGCSELLRPYRGARLMAFVAIVLGDRGVAGPAPLAKKAIDDGIIARRPRRAEPRRRRVRRQRARRLGRDATRRPTSSTGSASARCRTCGCGSSATCRRSRSASTSAARPACSSRA